ncbi:MAG: hypothetical protein MMC33_007273 [Icmadophila ericetorum]|nr:hypothetical protein [Icmadophila ericetorum]
MADLQLPTSLADSIVRSLPETAYYIPEFLSKEEESSLLSKIYAAPRPSWHYLSHRRLQAHPSPLTPQNTLISAPLPAWLADPIIPRLISLPLSTSDSDRHIFSDSPHQNPNHVLINEYEPGQGIFPHEDGGAYHPVVATVSLGSSIVFDITTKKSDNGDEDDMLKLRILQEPRSLLITTGSLYKDYLHGITETDVDADLNSDDICNWDQLGSIESFESGTKKRESRVSLTIRDVIKVKSLGKGLASFGKRVV